MASQAVCGDAAQHALEIGLLGDDPAVKQADQFPFLYGKHPLQRQFAFHATVRRLIIHLSDLAGVVQIRDRGAPVHHNRSKRDRVKDAPAPQVPGFRAASGRREIQPGEVRLAGGHSQLTKPVKLGGETLDGYFLLFIRVLLHPDVHAFPGLRAGERLNLGDFPVDRIAGLLKMQIFFFRSRMIRQFD